jgi:hypothetical protein
MTIRPYKLAEYLEMKPGTLLMGLMKVDSSWQLSTGWSLPKDMSSWKTVKVAPFLEHRTRWRQHLRKHSEMVKNTRIYKPPSELIRNGASRVIVTKLEVGMPIGIYLGHIIRCDGVSLVNVLTSEGYDVWL